MDVAPARLNRTVLLLLSSLWLISVILGFCLLIRYETATGAVCTAPANWPSQSSFFPFSDRFTLVMFVHPHCPCTTASISELSRLLTRCPNVSGYVVFTVPDQLKPGWEKDRLWNMVANLPRITRLVDKSGREATKFSALTSGTTLLYSPRGELLFKGGITAGRGHEGDNAGLDTIAAIAAGRCLKPANTAVFGCALSSQETRAATSL